MLRKQDWTNKIQLANLFNVVKSSQVFCFKTCCIFVSATLFSFSCICVNSISYTESWRMIEVGRHLWVSSRAQGGLRYDTLHNIMARWLLESSREEIPQPLGSLCQCSATRTAQQCCLVLRESLLCFTFCLWPPMKSRASCSVLALDCSAL